MLSLFDEQVKEAESAGQNTPQLQLAAQYLAQQITGEDYTDFLTS